MYRLGGGLQLDRALDIRIARCCIAARMVVRNGEAVTVVAEHAVQDFPDRRDHLVHSTHPDRFDVPHPRSGVTHDEQRVLTPEARQARPGHQGDVLRAADEHGVVGWQCGKAAQLEGAGDGGRHVRPDAGDSCQFFGMSPLDTAQSAEAMEDLVCKAERAAGATAGGPEHERQCFPLAERIGAALKRVA